MATQHASERTIGVGIVGAGFVARIHAEAYHRVHGARVALRSVYAGESKRVESFAREFGVARVAQSLEELLDDQAIRLVDVCAPNVVHADVAIAAARAGKFVAVEKPLTGYFGAGLPEGTRAGDVDRWLMLREALASADAVIAAVRAAGTRLLYAENWVYAPAIQKARRLLTTAGGAILRIEGEESHSGSHAAYTRQWRTSGGGSLLGKGCHPLGGALYLKYAEGLARDGRPIRPRSVTAEVASLTKLPTFVADEPKYLRTGWQDVEDWGTMLVTFDDGSVAQISAGDTTLGGIRNYLTAFGSRAVVTANINPNTACVAYAPEPHLFGDEYITEKIETKAGWTFPSPDEDYLTGYPQEMQDFVDAVLDDREPLSGALLARDVLVVVYGAYLAAAEGRRVELTELLR